MSKTGNSPMKCPGGANSIGFVNPSDMYRDAYINDPVNHPWHYTSYKGLEIIDLTEQMNFNRGNAVKYITRAGLKDPTRDAEIEDLEKALWYIDREIQRLKRDD